MAANLAYITIDCRDPRQLGKFWAQALDWVVTYDDDDGVLVAGGVAACPKLFLQPVPEPKSGKNRVHVDLAAGDFEAELDRLTGLGASVVTTGSTDGRSSAILADPEGNEFCLARG